MKDRSINSLLMNSASYRILLVSLLVFLIFSARIVYSQPYYVDGSAEAGGNGSQEFPFRTIQEGITLAQAGETVWVYPGKYQEQVSTQRNGLPGAPVTIRSYISAGAPDGAAPGWVPEDESKRVWVLYNGRGIDINHSYITIDGINVDGLWHSNSYIDQDGIFRDSTSTSTYPSGTNGIVRVNSGTASVTLRNIEVKNNQLHLVRVHGTDVLIDNAKIHRGISRTVNSPVPQPGIISADEFFRDAHGIEASDAKGLTITNTYIGYVSGDCIQSGRSAWNKLTVENSQLEIKPITEPILGLQAGTWFSEDIYDTKTPDNGQGGAAFNKGVIFRNNSLNGTRYSRILHGAVLNLKEGVEDILVEGNKIYDNRMTFRLRQPTRGYVIRNNFIYNNETVFRFEGPVDDVKVQNNTFYNNITGVHEIDGGATNAFFSKNIFADGQHSVSLKAPHIQWDHNIFYNVSSPQGDNRRIENPLFINPLQDNLNLQPQSPALAWGIGARPWKVPFFTLWYISTNAPVVAGELLELSIEVVNFGGETGTQTLELTNTENLRIASFENVSLKSGESQVLTFTWDLGDNAVSNKEVSVKSYDDVYRFEYSVLLTDIPAIKETPDNSTLNCIYPESSSPFVVIQYNLPKQEKVFLEVYTLKGQCIRRFNPQVKDAGTHQVRFDTTSLNQGIYLVSMNTGNKKNTCRLMVN